METLTVEQLIKQLKKQPQDAKVYMSTDTEGNSYSTLDTNENGWSIQIAEDDNVIVLCPFHEHLDIEEIAPKTAAIMDEETAEYLSRSEHA